MAEPPGLRTSTSGSSQQRPVSPVTPTSTSRPRSATALFSASSVSAAPAGRLQVAIGTRTSGRCGSAIACQTASACARSSSYAALVTRPSSPSALGPSKRHPELVEGRHALTGESLSHKGNQGCRSGSLDPDKRRSSHAELVEAWPSRLLPYQIVGRSFGAGGLCAVHAFSFNSRASLMVSAAVSGPTVFLLSDAPSARVPNASFTIVPSTHGRA